jgi:altronate hydrolase
MRATKEEPVTAPRVVRLSPQDNVVIAIDAVAQGTQAAEIAAQQPIPRAHTMPTAPRGAGAPLKMFGPAIGFASRGIAPG